MRTRWESTRTSLLGSSHTLEAIRAFKQLSQRAPELSCFGEPDAVMAFMHEAKGEEERKDRILRELVRGTREAGAEADVSWALVWLSLWPGLDAIYRRRLRDYRAEPEALVSEISDLFSEQVAHSDLAGISRLAATFLKNTERDLKRRLLRARAADVQRRPLPEDEQLGGEGVARIPREGEAFVAYQVLPEELRKSESWLLMRRHLGESGGPFLESILEDETPEEMSARLGITVLAARRRRTRALQKLRSACPRLN